jgi:hypothetical protein
MNESIWFCVADVSGRYPYFRVNGCPLRRCGRSRRPRRQGVVMRLNSSASIVEGGGKVEEPSRLLLIVRAAARRRCHLGPDFI